MLVILFFSFSQMHSQGIENALYFDGVDDYVTINSLAGPLAEASNFTIEFWMTADAAENTTTVRVNFFAINPAAPGGNKFSIIMGDSGMVQSGKLSIYEAEGAQQYLTSELVIGDNNCHHIAYVRTGNTGEAFIDGVSIGTIPVASAVSSTDRISLGQEWDNLTSSDFYNGELDELRVWNVARTQSEIQDNMYTRLTGAESGLIGCYNFNQGVPEGENPTVTNLIDLTTNHYDGLLIDFALNGSISNWVNSACISGTGINKYQLFSMLPVYPNPFTTSTTIEYELTQPSTVQLTIYDYLGKQVKVIEKKQAQGKQQITWNAEGLPAGVYFCVIKTNQGIETTKLIKL